LLIVCGPPGQAKSWTIRHAAGGEACWVSGNATAFWLCQEAYRHRGKPLVLDDADGLYRDAAGLRLLKALCQTESVKSVSWLTDARALKRAGIPRQFRTPSHVALIVNRWKSLHADVSALEDCAHFLSFAPSPLEGHQEAGRWFWEQEIYDFVAARFHLMKWHSLRAYINAAELKQGGLDWKHEILSRCLQGAALAVGRLKADLAYRTEEARAQASVENGLGCRASNPGPAPMGIEWRRTSH
jgi:hypothetical protein